MRLFYVSDGPDVKILGAENLEEGSDILLYCSVSSVPPATLIWTVNYVNAGNSALYITESSNSAHSGIYTCAASNHITGRITSAEHTLTVRGNKVLTVSLLRFKAAITQFRPIL